MWVGRWEGLCFDHVSEQTENRPISFNLASMTLDASPTQKGTLPWRARMLQIPGLGFECDIEKEPHFSISLHIWLPTPPLLVESLCGLGFLREERNAMCSLQQLLSFGVVGLITICNIEKGSKASSKLSSGECATWCSGREESAKQTKRCVGQDREKHWKSQRKGAGGHWSGSPML